MVQFGLKDLAELPSLKEFEEIRRLAFTDDEAAGPAEAAEIPEAGAAADGEPTAPAEGAVASRSEEAPAAPDEPAPAVDAGAPADESEIDQGG
jgi:segregation and condensation protein B